MTLCITFENYTHTRQWPVCRRTFLAWDTDECLAYAPSKSGVCAPVTERCTCAARWHRCAPEAPR